MNISLIITEGNYVCIDSDDSTCHGYYIIRFNSPPYTLQADLVIDGQVILPNEIVCGVPFFQNQYQLFIYLFYNKLIQ